MIPEHQLDLTLCEVCDERIEDVRLALGFATCWRHASPHEHGAAEPAASTPPWREHAA